MQIKKIMSICPAHGIEAVFIDQKEEITTTVRIWAAIIDEHNDHYIVGFDGVCMEVPIESISNFKWYREIQ